MVDEHPAHPYVWLVRVLIALGAGHRGDGDPMSARSSVWQCPAHHDESPSLAVGHSRDGQRAILHCYAGCAPTAVLAALPAPMRYLSRPPSISPERFAERVARRIEFPTIREDRGSPATCGLRLAAEHPYGSPPVAWLMRYRHPTIGAKRCSWESLNGHGERVPGLLGRELASLPLYQERDGIAAVALGDPVIVVESESSVDALRRAGVVALTWAGGAAAPPLQALRRVLGDHGRVLIFADGDEPGRDCAATLAAALPLATVYLPDEGLDARDVLRRLGAAAFRALVDRLLG